MPEATTLSAQSESSARLTNRHIWVVGLLLVAGLILLLALCLLAVCMGGKCSGTFKSELALPLLAIAGVLILLVALGLISVSFAFFGLTDNKQALGLPEGSVRAVVALSLVVLFAILTIFLYGGLSRGVELGRDLDQTRMSNLISNAPVSGLVVSLQEAKPGEAPKYTVTYGGVPNQATQDFAKQLLVMIGTLVTAVASFYFGGQTAASAVAAGVKAAGANPDVPQPTIRGIEPKAKPPQADPLSLKISGDNLNTVTRVRLIQGTNQIVAQDVKSNPHEVTCQIAIPLGTAPSKWNVIVCDDSGKLRAELPDGFEVTSPPQQ